MKAMIEAIFVILFILGSVAVVTYLLFLLVKWSFEYEEDDTTADYPKITYKLFSEMYAISPDKWKLKKTHVCYEGNYEFHRMAFKTKRDYRKYLKFKEAREAREREVERLKEEAKIAKCFQTDIDRYRAETLKEMKYHLPENMIPHDTGALRRSNTYVDRILQHGHDRLHGGGVTK